MICILLLGIAVAFLLVVTAVLIKCEMFFFNFCVFFVINSCCVHTHVFRLLIYFIESRD